MNAIDTATDLDHLDLALEAFEEACAAGAPAHARQEALKKAMLLTPHGKHSNTLEHGQDCAQRYARLITQLARGETDAAWPKWLQESGQRLLALQIGPQDPEQQDRHLETDHPTISYLTFHDCGKASTMTRDEDGRVHFPGHAEASSGIWRQAGGSALECELMAKDMILHTCSAEEAEAFASDPLAPTLLLAAYCETCSNAQSIFGGRESTSHKIKAKALARRARAILA